MKTDVLDSAEDFIRHKLIDKLPASLHYHSYEHVMDVLSAAERIADAEDIDEENKELLRIAVLFHDAGFTIQSEDHENLGCQMVRADLPQFGYSVEQIEMICGMIQATRIPQSPHNILEQIICDADLDYLGRDDYSVISAKLEMEIAAKKVLTEKEWLQLQVSFLEQHKYFTRTAKDTREIKKEERLQVLKSRLDKV